eukprot:scaffold7245_cov119-Isochrysis_galbana.AAC.3
MVADASLCASVPLCINSAKGERGHTSGMGRPVAAEARVGSQARDAASSHWLEPTGAEQLNPM